MKILIKSFIFMGLVSSILFANKIDKSIDIIEKGNNKLKSYQNQIDKNEEIKENLLNEYKYVSSSLKSTEIYNNQLEKIITSQKEELKSLDEQLGDIEQTQKNVFPLMLDMIRTLKTLVKQDIPFLLKERLDRVNKLEEILNKADIPSHEKYRIILEAFKIENDYARTIESYQDKLDGKTYNFLRLGRVGLYYQSLDLKNYGLYNKETKSWEAITDIKSKSNIIKAIKIAKKQRNVDFLNLPFLAKKEN